MLRTTTHSGELLQPRDLGKIEHNVHVLHSLARSALDQIVNHRDHLHHVCGFIHSNADAAHVRALDFPKARGVSDNLSKGLVSIPFFPCIVCPTPVPSSRCRTGQSCLDTM